MCVLPNPYTLKQTIEKLENYFSYSEPASYFTDAILLLQKVVEKSKNDDAYAQQLEDALIKGSTLECRAVFSFFGDYLDCTRRDTEPFYPYRHAVDSIDTALYYVKMGFVDKHGKRKEIPDLDDYASLVIQSVNAKLHDGKISQSNFLVNAFDDNGQFITIHQSDTLVQASAVARFVKGSNFHLTIQNM